MDPCLTASPSEIIKWCVKKIRPTTFFTSRLGIPQTKHDEGDRSRIEFFGDAAPHCKALYIDWLQTRKDMADAHFEWKDDLREKAVPEYNDLSSRYISPLLDKHGPRIWPATHDVHNGLTISSDYPKRLMYTREADRRTLTLYLYGWMICSLVPKLSAHPDSRYSKQRKEPGSTAPSAYRWCPNNEGAETITTSSHAAVSSASVLRRGDDASHECPEGNTPISHSVNAPMVPVAQMLPVRGVEEGSSQSPTNCTAIEASQDGNEDKSGTDTDAATSEWEEYQPPTASERRIKRRGYSTRTSSSSQNKRQKSSRHGPSHSSAAVEKSSTKTHSRRAHDEEVEGDEAGSYPSPPDMEQSMSGDMGNLLNFPNIHKSGAATEQQQVPAPERITEASGNISLAAAAGRQGLRSSFMNTNDALDEQPPLLNASQTIGPDEDVDPITGEVETTDLPVGPIQRPPNTSARPSLIVPIKLTTSSHETEELRKELASNIADMRRTGLCNPNILLLKSTVELLETLSKASHLRLREIYEDNFNHYQGSLRQWLQLLKNIIVLYEMTGFRGDLSERDEFLRAMPKGCPAAVQDAFIHGSLHLDKWLRNSGIDPATFAQEVASLLFHLGSWRSWMDQASVESMTTQFTQDSLAWYD